MTDTWAIRLTSDRARLRAHEEIDKAPGGAYLKITGRLRTKKQNDRQWALLSAVSDQLVWHGEHHSPEVWKHFFLHILKGGQWLKAENGGMIPIAHSSSQLSVKEHKLFTEVIVAFGQRHGVDFYGANQGDGEEDGMKPSG